MTAAVALALGADSVVVPVRDAAEARAVRAACSYKGSRTLNIGPELPYHVAKVPTAGIELLSVPPSEIAEIIAPADFVMASTANFFLAEGSEQALASLVSLQEECKKQGKPFLLLDDAPASADSSEDWLSNSIGDFRCRRRRPQVRTPTSRRRTPASPTSRALCAEAKNQSGKSYAPRAPPSRRPTLRSGSIGSGSSGSTLARTPQPSALRSRQSPSAAVSRLFARRAPTTRPGFSNASTPVSTSFSSPTSIPWRRRRNRSGTASSRPEATACGTAASSPARRSRR